MKKLFNQFCGREDCVILWAPANCGKSTISMQVVLDILETKQNDR